MKPILLAIGIMALPCIATAQYTYANLKVDFLETPSLQAAYTYENLRLHPVRAGQGFKSEFKGTGNYMTLKDALAKQKIRITEKGNGGDVNTLIVENISADTIIIITGDIVKGGKQDRVINKDLLLQPHSGKKNLEVFCVEAGRWSAADSRTSSAKVTAPASFEGYHNKASVSLRKVVEKEKDQGKVWSKVDELNKENKTVTSTKTYTAMTNSAEFSKKLGQYLAFFKDKFSEDADVIGVVVVSGNTVIGCDMFATHGLFLQQYESLLHSYATEAIVKGRSVTATSASVKTYTDKLMANEEVQKTTIKEKGNVFVEKGKKLRVSSFD